MIDWKLFWKNKGKELKYAFNFKDKLILRTWLTCLTFFVIIGLLFGLEPIYCLGITILCSGYAIIGNIYQAKKGRHFKEFYGSK